MTEVVSLSTLVDALRSATEDGKSGAFFITTENQHSAMITLTRGEITGMKYRSARGYDAASSLAEVGSLKFQTAAEPTELPGEGEVSTRAVLDILEGAGEPAGEDAGADAAPSAPGMDLDALRQRYIAAIGPIAGTLFDEAVAELGDELGTPDGVDRLVRKLAEQIDDAGEARSFIDDARGGL